jgi:hypothetical protein
LTTTQEGSLGMGVVVRLAVAMVAVGRKVVLALMHHAVVLLVHHLAVLLHR